MSHVRTILDSADVGSLGTLNELGSPFVTLVTVASVSPQNLAMLLSELAVHTTNLQRDPRCSLLLVEPGGESGDPLSGARLTLSGTATRVAHDDDREIRSRFLQKHTAASMYAEFADFAFYRFQIQQAHLVAGFGRIETLDADQL